MAFRRLFPDTERGKGLLRFHGHTAIDESGRLCVLMPGLPLPKNPLHAVVYPMPFTWEYGACL